jgi:hypothetical protein
VPPGGKSTTGREEEGAAGGEEDAVGREEKDARVLCFSSSIELDRHLRVQVGK